MISVKQKSRGCLLLLSILSALISSTSSTSTSSILTAPKETTHPSFANQDGEKSLDPSKSTSPTVVSYKTDPRDLPRTSPSGAIKAASLRSNPVQSHYLSKRALHPVSSNKLHPHIAKPFPPSSSPPRSFFQMASNRLPTSISTPSIPKTSLASTSKTWPHRHAKTSTFSPKATSSPKNGPKPWPSPVPKTAGPLFEHQPFFVTWNIPDNVCKRHNISMDTSPFHGVTTPAKVPDQFLSLFYTDRLGLYPHVHPKSRKLVNGGIPQRGNLKASLMKAKADINYYIPSKTRRGLAVIDWEDWRPLWERNWGNKKIYQSLSLAHALQKNSSLTVEQATEKAKQQFQVAARGFMSGMLAFGKAMRPNYLWGFYLFPNCYNHGWENPDYTGQCSEEVKRQNDELLWLWESSTALFPSIYLQAALKHCPRFYIARFNERIEGVTDQASLSDNPKAALMVRNRIQEALRVSTLSRRSNGPPIFAYMRPVFVNQHRRFLSEADLVRTIGESAAVGASGAVMWGASADFNSESSCEALSSYLSTTLNPYVTNVTLAAQLCSKFLCRGSGRCIRKNYHSDHYLHLNPDNFRVMYIQRRYLVLGKPTLMDLKTWSKRFTCQCYEGVNCTPRTYKELTKALAFSVKQWLYQKAHALNKALVEDTQKAEVKKNGKFNSRKMNS